MSVKEIGKIKSKKGTVYRVGISSDGEVCFLDGWITTSVEHIGINASSNAEALVIAKTYVDQS